MGKQPQGAPRTVGTTSWVREAGSRGKRGFPTVCGLQISLAVERDIVWVKQRTGDCGNTRRQVGPVHIRTQAPESPGPWSRLRGKPGRAAHSNPPRTSFPHRSGWKTPSAFTSSVVW